MSASNSMHSSRPQTAIPAAAQRPTQTGAPSSTLISSMRDAFIKDAEGRFRMSLSRHAPKAADSQQVRDPCRVPVRDIDAKDTMVSVLVCNPPVTFNVHRKTLLRSSAFLKAKAKPEWSKGEAAVGIPNHSSEIFGIYCKWLYSGCIVGCMGLPSATVWTSAWGLLADAFVLGEELMDTEFKDTVMDSFRAKAQGEHGRSFWLSAPEIVHTIYDGTPSSSAARKFVVDIFYNHAESAVLDKTEEYPTDFLLDLCRKSLSRANRTPMAAPGDVYTLSCIYHEHGKDGKCYLNGNS
ncbi:hypothetical protein M409DRAFT_55126 [Zasmidium cellare ATCC 36951]|uniref:BTB domain-containing protein n=1 Tax=Zasmidium cellare ATCC 36951 TaxID=1080233 RepID=A0A6A6CI35_ZASCE|nr:uncharacterized protein M409DRAFT_55126 [Zasmidium cellare ATCC 36951]KAF2166273.1 hypothetical protein M409DRAFT_55126 [Zasmidium cellare ATCC 36951]